MKGLITLFAAFTLTIGGFAITGCTENQDLPRGENGVTAGGNGEFGEDPVQAGAYRPARPDSTQPSQQPTY